MKKKNLKQKLRKFQHKLEKWKKDSVVLRMANNGSVNKANPNTEIKTKSIIEGLSNFFTICLITSEII